MESDRSQKFCSVPWCAPCQPVVNSFCGLVVRILFLNPPAMIPYIQFIYIYVYRGLQVPKRPRMDSHGPMSSNWVPSTSRIFAEPENRTLKVSAKMRNSRLQETSGNIVSPSFQGQSPQHALLWTVGPHFLMFEDAWRLRGKQSPPHGSCENWDDDGEKKSSVYFLGDANVDPGVSCCGISSIQL